MTAKYVDFDMSFKRHPVTGDIGTKTDVEAVKQSMKNLMKTSSYDRKYHPEIAARIKSILFQEASSITSRMLQRLLNEVITNFEPRVIVNRIMVGIVNQNQYKVVIYFQMVNTTNQQSVTTLLNRIL